METKKKELVRETAKKAVNLYNDNNLSKDDLITIIKSAMAWEISMNIEENEKNFLEFNDKLNKMIRL
jgi:hypothetical protein